MPVYGNFLIIPLDNSVVKKNGSHNMTVLHPYYITSCGIKELHCTVLIKLNSMHSKQLF